MAIPINVHIPPEHTGYTLDASTASHITRSRWERHVSALSRKQLPRKFRSSPDVPCVAPVPDSLLCSWVARQWMTLPVLWLASTNHLGQTRYPGAISHFAISPGWCVRGCMYFNLKWPLCPPHHMAAAQDNSPPFRRSSATTRYLVTPGFSPHGVRHFAPVTALNRSRRWVSLNLETWTSSAVP